MFSVVSAPAFANGLLVSSNGFVEMGVNNTGELNATTTAGYVGIGYKFTGQGGRTGFQDALTPGCPCEAWGVAANGIEGQVGQYNGNINISAVSNSSGPNTFTSVTRLGTLPGLTITQAYAISNETATGGLFKDTVTLTNTTGATLTDVRYARAMDWDVPPTEYGEYSTFVGTTTTANLLRSTDDGFAYANPISGMTDNGYIGPVNADGSTGPYDHGAFFIFGFGNLAAGASKTFNIFYGAGANRADALSLLSTAGPELYNLGNSNVGGARADSLPTFIFAFNGVGGTVVVPPSAVPEPASLALLALGAALLLAFTRRSPARPGCTDRLA